MMNDHMNDSPSERQAHPGYETTDVRVPSIGLFALGLAVMVALVLLVIGWAFWQMETFAKSTDSPRQPGSGATKFREPKLQDRPTDDLDRFRRNEDQHLSTYGWVDQKQGV